MPPPPPTEAEVKAEAEAAEATTGEATTGETSTAAPEATATDLDAEAVVPATAGPVSDLILSNWLRSVDTELAGLYAPKEDVRKAIAELVQRVFELAYLEHGKEGFSNCEFALEMNAGLLSNSFGAGMLAVAALATSAASVFNKNTSSNEHHDLYTIPEDTAVAVAEPMDMDEDLMLAIKMSQEMIPGEASPVPTTASIAVADNHAGASSSESVRPSSPVDISAVPGSSSTSATTGAPSGPTVTQASPPAPAANTPPHLLAPNLLLALTNDTRMQLIAEHWRKSESVLWLLLEISRLGAAHRLFMLKREVVAQLVDIFLGDQSPLCGTVYAVGSRRRAPSSYVTVVPGKDGSLPYVARNIPDWTHLVKLLSALVCQSNSMSLVEAMGEISFQCVQVKTLYTTLLRQARYTLAALPMIIHLSFENKPISDMIGEAFCEELSLANYDSTAHIFQAMERFLNIQDTLSYQRNAQLFGGGGDYNLLETMNITQDQPGKHRMVCVFIRSFLALVKSTPILRSVISQPNTKITSWAPWMLKFCFRFTNKCTREQAECAVPVADADKLKLNAAIERAHDKTASASSTTSPLISKKPTVFVCTMDTVGSADPLTSKGPFLRVHGEDQETESTQTWVQRAEKTSQMLYALLNSLGASPDALLPADTFDEEVAVVPALTNHSNSNSSAPGCYSTPTSAAVHPMPLGQSKGTQSGAGNSVTFPQFADGMSDEELAQLLQDGALGTEID